ncbi:TetR/AcrR family transcriptional regulator [Streptomonospora sp. PA3]|uniref:TetR/AcrR family transcriptional regulator n=1 Tax=Streptomonospora sp. PA3 TaxID=2607326 RepID=UPI0012DDA96F|nr:TetR/AcrR family transcriptional regulator [Streptomonospora sp. PA3]MUL43697.1 TetR/AcrR family transcriptional regulator [Streptomonospora sp. PA3]
MAGRKYEQRLRAESAQRTRRRILDALYRCLREAPGEPVGIDRVARLAGVARPTVYQVYGSRAGLFAALGEDLLVRGGFAQMLQTAARPDAREAVRGAIRGVVGMYAADFDAVRALSSMARLDATAAGGAVRRMEERRLAGAADLAGRLAEQGCLRPGVSVEHATDVLWLLTSFENVDLLHAGRSRTPEETADTLIAVAEQSLLR